MVDALLLDPVQYTGHVIGRGIPVVWWSDDCYDKGKCEYGGNGSRYEFSNTGVGGAGRQLRESAGTHARGTDHKGKPSPALGKPRTVQCREVTQQFGKESDKDSPEN